MLFNCFMTHGYLPEDFMKTAIVPIIKNKVSMLLTCAFLQLKV